MLGELFFAVASEPTAIPLAIVAALAAGMYPLGFMFGGPCSPCCCDCSCEEGELPETVTVTFSGFENKSHGPPLCGLHFESCFGGGAGGIVTAPGGDPQTDKGPVSGVALTDRGSGYAKKGRVEPTVTATAAGGSGTGATFEVTLAPSNDDCKLDVWKVASVAAKGSGSGYTDGEPIIFTVAVGDTAELAASATLQTERIDPSATVSVQSAEGFGAALSAEFVSLGGTAETWALSKINVDKAGDKYTGMDTLTITLDEGTIQSLAAYLKVNAAHTEPTLFLSPATTTGTGAALSASLAPVVSWDGLDAWEITAITVDDPGAGYQSGEYVEVEIVSGFARAGATANISSVDESGGILSVGVFSGGAYLDGGPIVSVSIDSPGSFYATNDKAHNVVVSQPGAYYREDESAPPYVADVSITIVQTAPSDGEGAVIKATINDEIEDPDFGKIESLQIEDGGADYLAWEWLCSGCATYLNDRPLVLEKIGSPESESSSVANRPQCLCDVYAANICGGWNTEADAAAEKELRIRVAYRGKNNPPVADLSLGSSSSDEPHETARRCASSFVAENKLQDCSSFSWSATNEQGQSISVSAGGTAAELPAAACCHPCCRGDEPPPDELSIQVAWNIPAEWENSTNKATYPSGTYVLQRSPSNCLRWSGHGFEVRKELCGDQCGECLEKCMTTISTPIRYGLDVVHMPFPGPLTFHEPEDPRIRESGPASCEDSKRCELACVDETPACAPQGTFPLDFALWNQSLNQLYGEYNGVIGGNLTGVRWWLNNVAGVSEKSCSFQNGYIAWHYSYFGCDENCTGTYQQCCATQSPWPEIINGTLNAYSRTIYNPLRYLELHPTPAGTIYATYGWTQEQYELHLRGQASGTFLAIPWKTDPPWASVVTITIAP
jgi:hypothetical protein